MSNYLEHFQSTLGRVGLKISVSNVLDLADPLYLKIPEEIRAAVWLAAKDQGWTKDGIMMTIKEVMGKRYDAEMANSVIEWLEDSAKKYPNILVDNSVNL